jgi:hypothetical protein
MTVILLLLAAGGWQLGRATWTYTKASLAQAYDIL